MEPCVLQPAFSGDLPPPSGGDRDFPSFTISDVIYPYFARICENFSVVYT